MIWVRRFLTFPLGLLLLVLLLIALVLLQVSDSFLDPGSYRDELRKADIYRFALVDVTTSALDEARDLDPEDFPDGLEENPLVTVGLSTEDIVSSLNRAIPPEWVQSIVEQVFDEPGRYITGERDHFQITVKAGDQVVAMVSEVKFLLRKADAYNLLFDEVVTPAIEDALAEDALREDLPFDLPINSDQIVASVRRVVDPAWVQAQVEGVLDEVTPYVVGEKDTFEINVQLSDRVQMALEEIKSFLRQADAYDLLYDDIVEPIVGDNLGDLVELPFAITFTNEEVITALRRVAPPEWVQEQAESVIDQVAPYLTGKEEHFAITVDLSENKREARDVIVETATSKFRQVVDSLPTCSTEQLSRLLSGGLSGLPECLPFGDVADVVIDRLVEELLVEVVDAVDPFILGVIPDDLRFTDAELREELRRAGAEEYLDLLDDVREIIRDGWTYTDADLREDLLEFEGAEAVERLDDARAFLADGWTYTESDLRGDIAEFSDAAALDDFDSVRDNLSRARTWKLLIYLPVLVVLALIGFLGGRSWPIRVAWAAAFLVITSGLLFVFWGPVFDAFAESELVDAAREDALQEIALDDRFQNTQRLVIDKAADMMESIASGFASGIATKSLVLLVIGLIALGVSMFWDTIRGLVRRLELF